MARGVPKDGGGVVDFKMNQIKHNNVSIIYVYYHCVLIISIFLAARAGLEKHSRLFFLAAFMAFTNTHTCMMGGYKNVAAVCNVTDRNGSSAFFFCSSIIVFPIKWHAPRAGEEKWN